MAAVVNGIEEDEWGDFVENRQGSTNGNIIDNSLSVAKEKVWEKHSGAIPLSIFGEEDVNDADLESSVNSNAQNSSFGIITVNAENQRDGLGSHGIKDFIFQLYGQDDHNSQSNGNSSKDGELAFDDDDDGGGGWEFKNAESGGFDGEADQIQGVENGVFQTFPSETNDSKKYNGVLNDVSQAVTREINQSDSFFTMEHESKHIICLENGSTRNMGNGDISRTLLIPSDDKFFHSSLPTVKSDLIVLGSNDLVSDLYHDYRPSIQPDGDNVGCNGNDSNDMVPDLWTNNEKDDDFDDDNWEFKVAPSDVFSANMAQDKDVLNSMAEIHEKSSLAELSNKKDMFDTHYQNDAEVAILSVGDVSNSNAKHQESEDVKTTNEITPSKDVFVSSVAFVPPPESSSKFGGGNINVIDLFDDFYDMSNKSGGNDKAGKLGDTINTNNNLEASGWEFKNAHTDICNQEYNSHQDQDFGNFWDNHMEKSSTSTVQMNIDAKNTHDKYFADMPSKIIEAKNLMGFGQFGDIFINGAQDGQSTSNGFTNFNISNSEDKSCNNYDNLKSTFFNDGIKDHSFGGSTDGHALKVTKLILEDFMDFYSTLKNASQLLLLRHLDDLKKTHGTAVLCHEDDTAMGFHQEIQRAHLNLDGNVKFSDNNLTKDCLSNDDFVKDFLETTQKPIFMALEMEYSLSEKILEAEKSLAPAIDLFKHATSILHLLNSTSGEKQRAYIMAWSKILSTCVHELHQGSVIWAQCLQANLCKQILSNTQGFHYFLALGEIYTVTKVLSVSLTIYKPWLLLNPVDSEDLWNSMKKCFNFWENSGLESSFKKMDVTDSNEIKEKIKSLFDSIDLIHNLDMPTLQNHLSGRGASLCQLSLLPLGELQEMKTVVWGGECYFLKLANLWANRISCDPPSLHHLNAG